MLFNSLHFLAFLPIVLILYAVFDRKYRWIILLIASYYFYMAWKPGFALLILISTVVDYFVGIQMSLTNDKRRRKYYLILSLLFNLGLLFFFKYYNFFSNSINDSLSLFGLNASLPVWDIILPVGISFYTFQTLSYSIDIYKKEIEPERHFGRFALYVSFFPQLVAGPIERAKNLIPRLRILENITYVNFVNGAMICLLGFFLKVVIADNAALFVDAIFNHVGLYHGFNLALGVILFAIQIYCDFSGYSLIAIGLAKIFGVELMENFRTPYLSKSIGEFWSRWHISLSTWFRDYVYIPLGGNKTTYPKWFGNLMITFLISGLWHGASWTFVIWGAFHGFLLIIEKALNLKPGQHKLTKIIRTTITFLLVCIGWIFFRANSVSDALYILQNLHVGLIEDIKNIFWIFKSFILQVNDVGFLYFPRWVATSIFDENISKNIVFLTSSLSISIALLFIIEIKTRKISFVQRIQSTSPSKKILLALILFNLIFIFGQFFSNSNFIYFQF